MLVEWIQDFFLTKQPMNKNVCPLFSFDEKDLQGKRVQELGVMASHCGVVITNNTTYGNFFYPKIQS